MYCRYCGYNMPEDAKFCSNCGKKTGERDYQDYLYRVHLFWIHHKKSCIIYLGWCTIHFCLFLFSNPIRHSYRYEYPPAGEMGCRHSVYVGDYSISGGFYPFSKSLSDIITGEKFTFSLIDNIDVYDFSEFFFYIILVPIIIYGAIKGYPYLSSFRKRIKRAFNSIKKAQNVESINIENAQMSTQSNEIVPIKIGTIINDTKGDDIKLTPFLDNNTRPISNSTLLQEKTTDTPIIDEKEMDIMSFFRRLLATIIDKLLIIVCIFPLVYIIPDKLGYYAGLLTVRPNLYDYMNMTFSKSNLVSLDIEITVILLVIALLSSFIFEFFLRASFGKYICGGCITGGVKVNSKQQRTTLSNILLRLGIYVGIMLGFVVIRFALNLNYLTTIILYYLVIDIPVLFVKRSLIDILSSTFVIKKRNVK